MEEQPLEILKGWSEEQVRALLYDGRGKAPGCREGNSNAWARYTFEEKQARMAKCFNNKESHEKSKASNVKYRESMTEEEKERRRKVNQFSHLKWDGRTFNEFYSSLTEEQKKLLGDGGNKGGEGTAYWRKFREDPNSPTWQESFEKLSEWDRNALLSVGRGSRTKEWMGKETDEERILRLEGSFHSPEAKVKSSRASSKRWKEVSREYIEKHIKSSFLSPESISKSSKGNSNTQTTPEALMEIRLKEEFPGKWEYNGIVGVGKMIGGKTPDFIRTDGTKEVIEVLGGLGRWHFIADGPWLVSLYEKLGYKCKCFWDFEIDMGIESSRLVFEGGAT